MISDERIMGFVEGEGCFSIAISKDIDRRPRKSTKKTQRKKPGFGLKIRPSFRILISAHDKPILEEIRQRLGVGEINIQKRSGNFADVAQYYVCTLADLLKIVDFFKTQQFHTAKGKSFLLWTQGLEMIVKKEHLSKEGFLKICELREQINPRKNKGGRSLELIKQILSINPEHIVAHKNNQILHNMHSVEEVPLSHWLEKTKGKISKQTLSKENVLLTGKDQSSGV